MTVDVLFIVDVFEVAFSVDTSDEELTLTDIRCNCDQWGELQHEPPGERWCGHSGTAWTLLWHAIRVSEGVEEPSDLPVGRDDVRLCKADPEVVERVWRRRFGRRTMADSFLHADDSVMKERLRGDETKNSRDE